MSQHLMERTIQQFFAALSAKDVEAWLATFTLDAISYDPVGTPANVGQAALRLFFDNVSNTFERISIAPEQILECECRAVAKWLAEGVGKNGRTVKFSGLDVFELDAHGKIKALWGFWDPDAMLAKLNG